MSESGSEIPINRRPEKPIVPKPPEVPKKPSIPLSDGRVIDMVEKDGRWVVKNLEDPNYFYNPNLKNSDPTAERPKNIGPTKNISPRNRWRDGEQQKHQGEVQRQQELQNLQIEGGRLSALVYTPEGQQQIADTKVRLTQIVEATSKKPSLEIVHPGFDRSPTAVSEVNVKNEQLIKAWEQSREARIGKLLNGDDMTNLESKAYLAQVLGFEPQSTNSMEENKKRQGLIDQFATQRRKIARALFYQGTDSLPPEQRNLSLHEANLRFYRIDRIQAQQSFARGWDEVKNSR